jgi:CheY-like chemotaxis protein
MHRVRVIHWKPAEAEPILELLRTNGIAPEFDPDPNGSAIARSLRANLPDAIVIDLSRLPSQGRELAVWLRNRKSTRNIPIVFVGGEEEKIARVKAVIPDAAYTTGSNLPRAVKKACASPVLNPLIPPSMDIRAKDKSTAQKLGIAASSTVAVIDPPRDYLSMLGELPEGAEVFEDPEEVAGVTLWFIRDSEAMLAALRRMRAIAAKTKLWIVWPKGASNKFREGPIRETALDNGLVDYKICSVNEQWSGILFARKKL